MNDSHIRKLENMYLNANINRMIYDTTKIKIGKGTAEITMEVSEKYFHGMGATHGSAYFKLLDDAAFFAANSLVEDTFVLTTNFNIHLIRPVKKGIITAKGQIKLQSRKLFIAESKLYNEANKEIAFGTGHFMRGNAPLSEDMGYR